MLHHLWPDVRFGIRMLAKHPTLSAASILTFGLGIGLATAAFNVASGVLLNGLPFEDAGRIVLVAGTDASRDGELGGVAVHDYVVLADRQRVFESCGAFTWVSLALAWDGRHPERFSGAALSVGAMRVLRVSPIIGRGFREGEDGPGSEKVLLLGYRAWQERFAGAENVLGKTVLANGVARTIVGVMPDDFAFPDREDVWIPLAVDPSATPRGLGPHYEVIARLLPDASVEMAQTQLSGVAAQLATEFPATNRYAGVVVLPFLERVFGARLRIMFRAMLGVGLGVLLIACVNVSNLLLARAALRQHEMAVRQALGAGRRRLLVQMLTEVSLLAAAGGLLGLLIDVGAMRWFVAATRSSPPPFFVRLEPDGKVLVFVAAITCLAALAAGLLPAWRATRLDLVSSLADEGRAGPGLRIGRASGALVVAEMAVSCALLIAAGLLVRSAVQVKTAHLPFAVEDVLTSWIDLPLERFPAAADRVRVIDGLLGRLQEHPGVAAAALADGLPADGSGTVAIQLWGRTDGPDDRLPVVRRARVTQGYFETFETAAIRGRTFTSSDRRDQAAVAVVNESFRRRYLPDIDPIGQRFRQGPPESDAPWLTIVGVVPDSLMQGFRNDRGAAGYYVPIEQEDVGDLAAIVVRAKRGETVTFAGIRSVVAEVDAGLAVYGTRSMRAVVDQQTLFYEVFGIFFTALGAGGLLLAAAGVYAVMSFSVTRRTRELAIRSALGARRGQLLGLVMRKAAGQCGIGLTFGLATGLLAGGTLQPILYRVSALDPVVVGTVVATLITVCLGAGICGARRVARLDPATALGEQ